MAAMNDIRNIVILTGAGVSAESGIDTFRTEGGLWERYKPEQACRVVSIGDATRAGGMAP